MNKVWLVIGSILLALAPVAAPAVAGPVATVGGQPLDDAVVAVVARDVLKFDQNPLPEAYRTKALRTAINNRLLSRRAKEVDPELAAKVERTIDLVLARDYFAPYYSTFAYPRAVDEVTVDTVLPDVDSMEDVVQINQIVFVSREQAETIRAKILAGEIDFETAARTYSRGLTADRGGEVGAVKRSTSMYSPEVTDVLFQEPLGTTTGIYDTQLGPSIFWIRDRKSGETLRKEMAEGRLPKLREAKAVELTWQDAEAFADKAHLKLLLTAGNVAGDADGGLNLSQPAVDWNGKVYDVQSVVERSGGLSHGAKDVLTIAENAYRDLALRSLYVSKKGALPGEASRREALTDHYTARAFVDRQMKALDVTDGEIAAYLVENPEKYSLPERIDLGMLYAKTPQRLKQMQERLGSGQDFETVARAWSQHTSAKNGGRLGVVPVSGTSFGKGEGKAPEVGLVSEPLRIEKGDNAGFYLFKVYAFFPAQPADVEHLDPNTRGAIRSSLLASKREKRIQSMLVELYRSNEVEVL